MMMSYSLSFWSSGRCIGLPSLRYRLRFACITSSGIYIPTAPFTDLLNRSSSFVEPTLSRCKKRKNLLPSAEYPAGLLHALQGRDTDGISLCRTFGSLRVACFYHQRLRPYWYD